MRIEYPRARRPERRLGRRARGGEHELLGGDGREVDVGRGAVLVLVLVTVVGPFAGGGADVFGVKDGGVDAIVGVECRVGGRIEVGLEMGEAGVGGHVEAFVGERCADGGELDVAGCASVAGGRGGAWRRRRCAGVGRGRCGFRNEGGKGRRVASRLLLGSCTPVEGRRYRHRW